MFRLDSSDIARAPGWHLPPCEAQVVLRCEGVGQPAYLWGDGLIQKSWAEPLDALRWLEQSTVTNPPLRWVGFLNYDLGQLFETLPSRAVDDSQVPLFAFASTPGPTPAVTSVTPGESDTPYSDFSRPDFESAVARVIEYIRAGDIFQVNLAQRLALQTSLSPETIYGRLISNTPALHGALLNFGDFAVVSNSPELFLRVTPDRRVVTRPIKGTRPNSPGMAEELLASTKDAAELAMIVDLLRNDLGRVCTIGSVKVTHPRTLETHPTVLHTTATIEGHLRPDVGLVELLHATFPCGSVTGAPKIRAMEIIDELERHRRGVYCGAIGYVSAGEIHLSVAIRTLTLKDGLATFGVGGGIVADSTPAGEYEETLVKAKALLRALGGLDFAV